MCNRIQSAGGRDSCRQTKRQVNVVDHGIGDEIRRPPRGLDALRGLTEDRRHFRTGVSGGHRDMRQPRAQRQGFSQTHRRAAADRDQAVDVLRLDDRQRRLGNLHRGVHAHAGKQAGQAVAEIGAKAFALVLLFAGGQHQRPPDAQALDLLTKPRRRACAEHHTILLRAIGKGIRNSTSAGSQIRRTRRCSIDVRDAHGVSPKPAVRQSCSLGGR